MATTKEAHYIASEAIRTGTLVRLPVCELCDKKSKTMSHHWKGYDYPLDVWWVCGSCNQRLTGFHDGSLTKEQARFVIQHKFIYGSRGESHTRQMISKYPPSQANLENILDDLFKDAGHRLDRYLQAGGSLISHDGK